MDEKSDEILEQIESQRNQLGANLNELQTRVRQTTDWRMHFDRNPMLMLGAALGGGIMLGAMVSTARSRSSGSYTGSKHFTSAGTGSTATSVQRSRASETIDHVKAALIAFATAKAKEFMNAALPGFDNYLRDAESKGSRGEAGDHQTDYSAGSDGQPAYGQQTSGSGPGANYGQNAGTDYGRPAASQKNYSTERQRAGSSGSNYGNS